MKELSKLAILWLMKKLSLHEGIKQSIAAIQIIFLQYQEIIKIKNKGTNNQYKSFDFNSQSKQEKNKLKEKDEDMQNKSYSFSSLNNSLDHDLQLTDKNLEHFENIAFPDKGQNTSSRL